MNDNKQTNVDNITSEFVVKDINEYKEVENVKTKVWVIKLSLTAFLSFILFMIVGALWIMYNNPESGIGGDTLEQLFSIIKVIFDGVF